MRSSVLQAGGGVGSQLVRWLSSPTSTEGAALYLLILVLLGIGGKLLWDWYTEDDTEEVEFSDVLDEETLEQGEAERQLLDSIMCVRATVQ